jgi:DNA helicase-2/ATP-dependent DNA helicase PcrA
VDFIFYVDPEGSSLPHMSFLKGLNPQQQKAVKTVNGPVMVVAGPGSGKTRVLTYRIAHLIGIGVPAYNILALTFTNKAADEMKERIVGLVGDKSRQLWMGTFHSMFARLLRYEAETIGYEKHFSIYDTIDSLALIKRTMETLAIPHQQFNPQAIRARISAAKNQLVSPEEYAQRALDIFEEKTSAVYRAYERQLRRSNAMDFDDLLLKPIELFSSNKKILAKYQDRFRFILIDEYQDTNHAQYVLIKLLAEKYRNICVVGDDAQSIYAFRGADIRNILDFQRDYPEAIVIRLEQNYRSTKNILSVADNVIKNNRDQITKDLWTENNVGEPISLLACEDDRHEGSAIVARIFEESHRLKIDFKHFAIMYRTNAQSRTLEDALRRNSIPYVIIGGIEFYQRKEVKDVLGYLRLLTNPQDDESFLRVVNTPNRGLGDVAIERLTKFAEETDLALLDASGRVGDVPQLTAKARSSFAGVFATIQKYIELKSEMSLSELARAFVDEIGILRIYKEEGTHESLTRWENVQELLSAITEFTEQRPDASLEGFLQEVSLVSDVDRWDDSHNAVTLMTLHAAKGLEFPVVFLTGLEEGLLPFYNSALDQKDLEEERRLFYVGVTRAMTKLYLTYVRVRYRFGEMTYQSPSRFLEEMGRDTVEVVHVGGGYSPRTYSQPEIPTRPTRKRQPATDNDAHLYRDAMPDYDNETLNSLRMGAMVEHDVFGRGKVLSVGGNGDMVKAIVDFPSVGRKHLLLKYAKLKVL